MNLFKILPAATVILLSSSLPIMAQQKKSTPAQPVKPAEQKKPIYTGAIPPAAIENPLVKVGNLGGVSKADYDFYLLKTANKNGKTVDKLTPDERKIAMFTAIDDELIFQAALADGALKDEYTCWKIIEIYKSNNMTSKIEPRSFTDEELEKFYKANPEKFTKPASVKLKGLKFMTESDQEVQKVLKQVNANPDSVKNWIELDWIEGGKVAAGLPQNITDPVTKLKKGQNSGIVTDRSVGWKFIFLVTDRKEPELIPFAEAMGKVRFEYISVKQEELKKKELEQLGKGGQKAVSEEEMFLNAAVKSGLHRDLLLKIPIITAYVSKKNKKREDLLPELKKKFKVDILKLE